MATEPEDSFKKVNYLIRPCKQVERKLFIEAMHCLESAGYPIRKYTYVGLGSVFYMDFILFHKYLYLDDMICAEAGNIPRRMQFNLPYKFITLKNKPVGDVLASLKRNRRYLVWLDYDNLLNSDILNDTGGYSSFLGPGSILIVTVRAEPRFPNREEQKKAEELSKKDRDTLLLDRYREEFGKYLSFTIQKKHLATNEIPKLFALILRSKIQTAIAGRSDILFRQLFNLSYSDTARMLTLGGIIETENELEKLLETRVVELEYVTESEEPIEISVPPLTLREKQWLDQNLRQDLEVEELEFELEPKFLKNYKQYYRYYPTYYEAII